MGNILTGNDFARQKSIRHSIYPQSIATTITGSEVDTTGEPRNIVVVLNVGALAGVDGTNYFTLKITQAIGSGGTFVDADAYQYLPVAPEDGSVAWDLKIDDAAEANNSYRLNFRLKKDYKYIKIVLTETGDFTSALVDGYIDLIPNESPTTI